MNDIKEIENLIERLEKVSDETEVSSYRMITQIAESIGYVSDSLNAVADAVGSKRVEHAANTLSSGIERAAWIIRDTIIDMEKSKSERNALLCESLNKIAQAISENNQEK